MSDKDFTIAAVAICLVCIFTPKPVALGFIVVALVAAYFINRPTS